MTYMHNLTFVQSVWMLVILDHWVCIIHHIPLYLSWHSHHSLWACESMALMYKKELISIGQDWLLYHVYRQSIPLHHSPSSPLLLSPFRHLLHHSICLPRLTTPVHSV
jgi:hypothetical protein